MKAMVLRQLGPLAPDSRPLEYADLPKPVPGATQVLIRVATCGVCHTELDEIEGRTPPPTLPIILGHQVVGTVAEIGPEVHRHAIGDRVGVGWIHRSSGGESENVSDEFRATGRDVDGGYAEYMLAEQNYAFSIPAELTDEAAAPLLCAGAIGYRSIKLTQLRNGQGLGLMGFGASAHLVLPTVRHLFPDSPVYVFARDANSREFARESGADWAGDISDRAPQQLAAIIDTTPAWRPVVESLAKLAPGGRLVINAIRKEDADKAELLRLDYASDLWMEKEIKSVANITGGDIAEFLPLAAAIPLRPKVAVYSLNDANRALHDLRSGTLGAKVLQIHSA